MSKEVFDPAPKLPLYLKGGFALFLFGLLATLLNTLLPVEDYQKISNFSVFFFTGGGALMMIVGAPALAGLESEKLRSLQPHLWKIATGLVFASFAALVFDRTEGSDYLLLGLLLVGYIIFLGLLLAQREYREKAAKTIETIEVIVVAVSLAIFIKAVGVQAFKIPSGSMLETLQIGDQLLVSKFLYGIPLPYTDVRLPAIRDPKRGDIVVFAYPGADNPDKPIELKEDAVIGGDIYKGEDFIKRIVAIPGDKVEIDGTVVKINGEAGEQWGQYDTNGYKIARNPAPGYSARMAMGPFTVPEGYYFVMGDNRDHSNDSRYWGFVKKGRIRGKAFVIYFSWLGSNRVAEGLKRIGTLL